MKPITPKQRLFVHEYLVDMNGAQAAIRSGYGPKGARVRACKLLKIPAIKKAVTEAREKRIDKLIMTRDEIRRELTIIGRSDIKNYFDIAEGGEISPKIFDEMPDDTSRALESIEEIRTIRESSDGKDTNLVTDRIKFKTHSKISALELLSKLEGYIKDPRIEIPGVEKALYELSEKFMPAVEKAKRSDGPK